MGLGCTAMMPGAACRFFVSWRGRGPFWAMPLWFGFCPVPGHAALPVLSVFSFVLRSCDAGGWIKKQQWFDHGPYGRCGQNDGVGVELGTVQ